MEDLKRMAVFAAVVQHGSMSGAARALGMSTSAVSQPVSYTHLTLPTKRIV